MGTARIFRNGRSQAVRIPKEYRLPDYLLKKEKKFFRQYQFQGDLGRILLKKIFGFVFC